ncbi:hypothetical protein [Nocardioides litoris]|nr:hypothetical protein [Nocardioides litoris]
MTTARPLRRPRALHAEQRTVRLAALRRRQQAQVTADIRRLTVLT